MSLNKNLPSTMEAFLYVVVPSLFIAGCTPYFVAGMDDQYDSSHIYVDSIDKALEEAVKSVYRIETSTTFRAGNDLSTLKAVGMAFSLDEQHLLTAKHVTSIDSFLVQTPLGLMRLPIPPEAKVEETTSLVFDDGSRIPVSVIYRDQDMDFAVLEAEKGLSPPSYPIGNSKDFKIVNMVILPANFQTGLNIRVGYVTQLDFIRYGPKGEIAEKNDDIFGISAVVSEGDSGSPVLFLRDGKFELGGIITFIVLPARGLGYGLKINSIMEKLQTRKEAHPWLLPLLVREN